MKRFTIKQGELGQNVERDKAKEDLLIFSFN